MVRNKIFKPKAEAKGHFRWRNHEIFRIETFSDAVFGFAITLLVVSLEVPVTFHEMVASMRGMLGFAICFVFLMIIWYQQYLYFRYFGLRDLTSLVLNGILLFVVLFYVYPLKFLFTLLTLGNTVEVHGTQMERIESYADLRQLMIIYSAGLIAVYLTFMFMFLHALKKKDELHFTIIELFNLRTQIYKNLILVLFGLTCMIASLIVLDNNVFNTGMIFIFIYPVFYFYFNFRSKRLAKLVSADELAAHNSIVEKSKNNMHFGKEI